MKRCGIVLAIAALSSVATLAQEPSVGVSVRMSVPLESKTLKGAPYSAETVNDRTQTLSDGNRIVQHSTGRVYRDSEGRVRREEDRPSGGVSISIIDPVGGVSWALDSETRTAWKTAAAASFVLFNKLEQTKADLAKIEAAQKIETARTGEAVTRRQGRDVVTFENTGGRFEVRRSSAEQRTEETLASRMLEGVRVDGRRVTSTVPAGAIGNDWPIVMTVEEWTSPELQVLVLTERKDPREGDSSYRLVNITRAEPAASLFQVPSDYTIRETGIKKFEKQ